MMVNKVYGDFFIKSVIPCLARDWLVLQKSLKPSAGSYEWGKSFNVLSRLRHIIEHNKSGNLSILMIIIIIILLKTLYFY